MTATASPTVPGTDAPHDIGGDVPVAPAPPADSAGPGPEAGAEVPGGPPVRHRDLGIRLAWLAALAALAVLVWPTTLGGATSLTIVSGTSMEPTFHGGDLAVVRRGAVAVGDVIVYAVPRGEPGEGRHVIHRVIGGDAEAGYVTQGDNQDRPDLWRPRPGDVLGTVRFVVPQGGTWILRVLSPVGLGIVAAGLFAWAFWPRDGAPEGEPDPTDG